MEGARRGGGAMSQGGKSMIIAVITHVSPGEAIQLFYALVCQTGRLVSFVSMVCCDLSESDESSESSESSECNESSESIVC